MKISELIAKLREIEQKCGDIPVYAGVQDNFEAVVDVEYSYEEGTADIILDNTL